MTCIDYVDVANGEGVEDTDNILRIHGVHPRTMRQHYALYRELMYGPGPLSRVQREMVALVVSVINSCHY